MQALKYLRISVIIGLVLIFSLVVSRSSTHGQQGTPTPSPTAVCHGVDAIGASDAPDWIFGSMALRLGLGAVTLDANGRVGGHVSVAPDPSWVPAPPLTVQINSITLKPVSQGQCTMPYPGVSFNSGVVQSPAASGQHQQGTWVDADLIDSFAVPPVYQSVTNCYFDINVTFTDAPGGGNPVTLDMYFGLEPGLDPDDVNP